MKGHSGEIRFFDQVLKFFSSGSIVQSNTWLLFSKKEAVDQKYIAAHLPPLDITLSTTLLDRKVTLLLHLLLICMPINQNKNLKIAWVTDSSNWPRIRGIKWMAKASWGEVRMGWSFGIFYASYIIFSQLWVDIDLRYSF